jgi:hypothetical protein
MKKKEFPSKQDNDILNKLNIDSGGGGGGFKLSAFYDKAFSIIKFIMGVCLLPFVYAVSKAFFNQLNTVEGIFQDYFWAGAISFIIIYLFVWEPAIIYSKGHKLLEIMFQFFKPMVKVAPYLLPIYTIVISLLYAIFSFAIKTKETFGYFIFALSFSLALHLVFGAKSVRGKKGDFLKANYIFGFSFVYIIDMMLLAFVLSNMFQKFSFVNFSVNSFQIGRGVLVSIFKQLFSV